MADDRGGIQAAEQNVTTFDKSGELTIIYFTKATTEKSRPAEGSQGRWVGDCKPTRDEPGSSSLPSRDSEHGAREKRER